MSSECQPLLEKLQKIIKNKYPDVNDVNYVNDVNNNAECIQEIICNTNDFVHSATLNRISNGKISLTKCNQPKLTINKPAIASENRNINISPVENTVSESNNIQSYPIVESSGFSNENKLPSELNMDINTIKEKIKKIIDSTDKDKTAQINILLSNLSDEDKKKILSGLLGSIRSDLSSINSVKRGETRVNFLKSKIQTLFPNIMDESMKKTGMKL